MNAKHLSKILRQCPANYRVGIVIKRPDGDEFYEIEPSDIDLSFDTVEGDKLPFGIVSLGSFNGTAELKKRDGLRGPLAIITKFDSNAKP